jgi:hypothetical protein
MAHRGGRIIDTDTLRISLVLLVSSDDQEREQGSEDNTPNVSAHQSRPAAAWPLNNLASRQLYVQHFKRLMSRLIADLSIVHVVFHCRCDERGSHADTRLRPESRGRNDGIREKLAAGVKPNDVRFGGNPDPCRPCATPVSDAIDPTAT